MKKIEAIVVNVLEIKDEKIKVMLPFAKIPIQMNRLFFIRRLRDGYFKLHRADIISKIFQKRDPKKTVAGLS